MFEYKSLEANMGKVFGENLFLSYAWNSESFVNRAAKARNTPKRTFPQFDWWEKVAGTSSTAYSLQVPNWVKTCEKEFANLKIDRLLQQSSNSPQIGHSQNQRGEGNDESLFYLINVVKNWKYFVGLVSRKQGGWWIKQRLMNAVASDVFEILRQLWPTKCKLLNPQKMMAWDSVLF